MVSLRLRLVLLFGLVAGLTAFAIVLAAPAVLRYEFERIEGALPSASPAVPLGSDEPSADPSGRSRRTKACVDPESNQTSRMSKT